MEKSYLFTPGPTPVPPEVLAAQAEPMVHHRGADFRVVYERALERLGQVFYTSSPVLLFSASGTGAMDSSVTNLTAAGDPVAVVVAGAFGERWAKICAHYGLDVRRIDYAWGEIPDPAEVAAAAHEHGAKVLFCTQSETSTGVVADVRAIKQAAGDTTVVVDAVSSLGAVPLEMDAWGIDVVVSGSQKALMCPPGLAMAAVADRLYDGLPASRSFYFDWKATRKAQDAFDAAFTPAVSLIKGLDVALGMMLERGLEAGFERHVRLGRAARAGIKAMGLELFSPDSDTSAVVTAARTPEGVDAPSLLKHLRQQHGVTLAPGQGALKQSIFRIGHIGWFDVFDIAAAIGAVELGITELGGKIERGRGITAAFEAYELPSEPAAADELTMWPEPVERVAREIRRGAIDATVQEFPEGTPTADAAARAIGCAIDQVVKSVVFVADGVHVLALVPGDRRADEGKLAAATGAAEVRVAYAREVVAATGFEPGAVAPFPLPGISLVLLERTILQHDRVWIGAGSPTHMAGLAPAELQRLSKARAADLVAPR